MKSGFVSEIRTGTIIVNGYATQGLTQEMLNFWAEDLTYVTYYSYGFNAQGDLIPLNDTALLQYAYNSGVGPLMALTPYNEYGEYSYDLTRIVFTDPNARDRLINNIVLNVLGKKYFGMVFNFGYIAPQDREQFVVTVSKAAARLNSMGALVMVSITPGINDMGIDYAALNKAANFIELKAFRQAAGSETPGPLSSADGIYNFLAFNTVLDTRKVLLGISNYGYDWAIPSPENYLPAQMLSNDDAERQAKELGAVIQYDDRAKAPFYLYHDVAGIQHIVWFENEESIKSKLQLVDEFDLGGISIWTIMSPFPAGTRAIRDSARVLKVKV
ncbi:MAG: glycoside hydrolase [Bacillota bacterium]|jgi:spore germination protein|nr:glycoside hydrolase [Bacillota bacterium]